MKKQGVGVPPGPGIAVARQFSAREHAVREVREKTTLRIIALSFFALAAHVFVGAARALTGAGEADRSIPGTVLAALPPAIMPFLSAVLLVGLVLDATLGWSWADPIAALVIAAVAVQGGHDARQGRDRRSVPASTAGTATADAGADACGCRPGCDCCS